MTINEIYAQSISRANRWHPEGLTEWSALEWAGAMAGEAGEAANAAKKLKRLDTHCMSINEEGRHFDNIEAAKAAVANEVADTILYGLCLLARIGCEDPEATLRNVFNTKSVEYGFPERL